MTRWMALALLCLLTLGCAAAPEGPDRPVVRIDGKEMTRGELETYLASNLAADGEADFDLVRSRLLDAWIDERLLQAEAADRRLTIPDESLDALLDDPDYESGQDDRALRRDNLRQRLMIEMLQGQVLQDVVLPTVDEAAAWLDKNPDAPGMGRKVELRSLRFDDADRAQAVHRGLRRNRFTYNEAVLQNTDDESQGIPTVVAWESLPPEVRKGIEKLKPRWSSVPVELGGSIYVFQVVRWIETNPETRIEAAREEIYAADRRVAWDAFVDQLREGATIKILHENLPFAHIPSTGE